MAKIVVELRICTNIEKTHLFAIGQLENNNKRIQQYVSGIKKFLQLNKNYIDEKKIDVYITDNTVPENEKLPIALLDIIPKNVKIITCYNNNYGCFNKGAGDIEQWIHCKDFIKKYDYFIHFEPRQLLVDNYFIDSFMKNPRTLFTYNHNTTANRHFNTGLFSCKTKELTKFINDNKPDFLVKRKLGIEYALYNFYETNKIEYDTLDKMNLIWYDTYGNKSYHW